MQAAEPITQQQSPTSDDDWRFVYGPDHKSPMGTARDGPRAGMCPNSFDRFCDEYGQSVDVIGSPGLLTQSRFLIRGGGIYGIPAGW